MNGKRRKGGWMDGWMGDRKEGREGVSTKRKVEGSMKTRKKENDKRKAGQKEKGHKDKGERCERLIE